MGILWFICGIFVGALIGVLIYGLVISAGEYDDRMERRKQDGERKEM